jgi:hypothetical protein
LVRVVIVPDWVGKSGQAVMEVECLGLKVVDLEKSSQTTTSAKLIVAEELFSAEEALKI